MNIEEITRIVLHIGCFILAFYGLSGLDFSKIMLNRPNRGVKGQTLLILLSMAIGYLVAQFMLAIVYNI